MRLARVWGILRQLIGICSAIDEINGNRSSASRNSSTLAPDVIRWSVASTLFERLKPGPNTLDLIFPWCAFLLWTLSDVHPQLTPHDTPKCLKFGNTSAVWSRSGIRGNLGNCE